MSSSTPEASAILEDFFKNIPVNAFTIPDFTTEPVARIASLAPDYSSKKEVTRTNHGALIAL